MLDFIESRSCETCLPHTLGAVDAHFTATWST